MKARKHSKKPLMEVKGKIRSRGSEERHLLIFDDHLEIREPRKAAAETRTLPYSLLAGVAAQEDARSADVMIEPRAGRCITVQELKREVAKKAADLIRKRAGL